MADSLVAVTCHPRVMAAGQYPVPGFPMSAVAYFPEIQLGQHAVLTLPQGSYKNQRGTGDRMIGGGLFLPAGQYPVPGFPMCAEPQFQVTGDGHRPQEFRVRLLGHQPRVSGSWLPKAERLIPEWPTLWWPSPVTRE